MTEENNRSVDTFIRGVQKGTLVAVAAIGLCGGVYAFASRIYNSQNNTSVQPPQKIEPGFATRTIVMKNGDEVQERYVKLEDRVAYGEFGHFITEENGTIKRYSSFPAGTSINISGEEVTVQFHSYMGGMLKGVRVLKGRTDEPHFEPYVEQYKLDQKLLREIGILKEEKLLPTSNTIPRK